jgi:hypothetical protein
MAYIRYKAVLPLDIQSNKSGNSGGSRGFFGLEKSEEDDEVKIMGVIIDEIKEVMVTQLADLLDTKKQLD